MPGTGAAAPARPLCRCHGEPMRKNGPWWACAVKRRAKALAAYHAGAREMNYARVRRALRARIRRRRQQIAELEASLAEENTRGG